MQFEFLFNERLTRSQTVVYFDFVWKDFLSKNRKNLYFGIPFIVFGGAIIYGGSNLGYFFLLIGLFQVFHFGTNYRLHKASRKQYFAVVEKYISDYANERKTIWEFNEDHFGYRDFKYDLKINWVCFTNFIIIENNLVLDVNDNISGNFFLNKEEVGNEDFDRIVHFLETKINRT